MSLSDLRKDYMRQGLSEQDVAASPIAQFQRWFEQALASTLPEPNAMALATTTTDGHPSARMVLLKGFDEAGFVFYTNYDSRKGHELTQNPWAALVFYWAELERQVRIEGQVILLSADESDTYFHSRPVGSQIGAWASHQSQVLANRAVIEQRVQALDEQYQGQEIPRPPYWGGLRVIPTSFEFWQGRPSRLHDRLRYRHSDDGSWQLERLSP